MNIEAYVEKQKQNLKDFKELAKTNPEAAKEQAKHNLIVAGIIDEYGELAEHYRSE